MKNILPLLILALIPFCIVIAQTKNEHFIYWENERQLSWNDFKIKQGSKSYPAKTFIFAYPKRDRKKSSISIYTVFHKKYSWVLPQFTGDSILLEFFQVRFNIMELYSRKVRKVAFQIAQDDKVVKKSKEIKKAFRKILDEGINEIKKFDEESEYGQNTLLVIEKSKEVSIKLEKLNQFSESIIFY